MDWILGFLIVVAALLALLVAWALWRSMHRFSMDRYDPMRERLHEMRANIINERINAIQEGLASDLMPPARALREIARFEASLPVVPQMTHTEGRPSVFEELVGFPRGDGELARLGYRIFKWLLALAVLLLIGLGVYAWRTYPDMDDVSRILPLTTPATDLMGIWEQLRTGWLQQIKDLGQLFVLTPVFPLIGAVIGYIFGVRKGDQEGGNGGQPGQSGQNGGGPALPTKTPPPEGSPR